ncbi:MAG: ATP-binding protein [Phycisphaerales bacterium]|nr:ATP-binding protein [Phycisphaerales bacterium]
MPITPPAPRPKAKLDLAAVLIRRRKAAVALLITLSIGVAALAILTFARLMPVRGDAAHSVEIFNKARALEGAITRANEAVANRDRTPREAQAAWNDVAPFANTVAALTPDDDAEERAISEFNAELKVALELIATGVSQLEQSDPILVASARRSAGIGLARLDTACRRVLDVSARQVDAQMYAARTWLAICIALVLLTGLMMAVTVLTWVYANYADRARARRLNPAGSLSEHDAEAAHRMRLLVESSPLAVVEWNSDFVCTRWAGRAQEMFGRSAEEVVGKRWDTAAPYLHPEDKARVNAELAPLLRGDTERVVIHHRNLKPDGSVVHCVWYNSALREGDDIPRTFLSLATDVTRTVEAERAARDESQMVLRIAAAAPLGITACNAAGRIVFTNDYSIKLMGGTREDLVGADLSVADWRLEELDGTPIPEDMRPARIALRTGKAVPARAVRVFSRCSAEPAYLALTAVPLLDSNAKVEGVLLIQEDVSARTLAHAERESLTAELNHARRLEAVGSLASGIAHDFSNALLAISYSADLLVSSAASGSSTAEHAARLAQAIALARDFTGSLVNYAAGRDSTRKPLDLAAFVAAHCKFVGRLLPDNFKVVCVPPSSPEPVVINAADSQLLRVLLNLAVNARDAMPGGGTITLAVRADTQGPSPSAVLEVTDSGHGMPPEVSGRVFEPYFTTKHHGSGIGLATVKQIVAEHGGSIHVDSAPGKGARFTIRLPLLTGAKAAAPLPGPSAAPTPAQPVRPPAAAQPAKLPRAMVVEGDDRVRPLIIQTLRNSGYQVDSFSTTAAALEAFSSSPPSWAVVLMEVEAGGIDGVTCLRRMRRAVPTLPAVLLTADSADTTGHLADEQTRVLLKPFSVVSLRTMLTDLFSHQSVL